MATLKRDKGFSGLRQWWKSAQRRLGEWFRFDDRGEDRKENQLIGGVATGSSRRLNRAQLSFIGYSFRRDGERPVVNGDAFRGLDAYAIAIDEGSQSTIDVLEQHWSEMGRAAARGSFEESSKTF